VNAVLIYSLARFGILLAVLALGYLAGLRDIWLIGSAFLGSGLISFVVLDQQRTAMGQRIASYFGKISTKLDDNTRKEDVD
jgi:hypothetical protein